MLPLRKIVIISSSLALAATFSGCLDLSTTTPSDTTSSGAGGEAAGGTGGGASSSASTGGGGAAQDPCHDGSKNNLETDVDCGGGSCPPCENSFGCMASSDCKSNQCIDGTCQPPPVLVGAQSVLAPNSIFSIPTPEGAQSGDLLILLVAHGGGSSTVSALGWTVVTDGGSPGNDPKLDTFYRTHDGSTTYTVVKNDGGGSAILAAFRGVTFGTAGTPNNTLYDDITTTQVSTLLFVSLSNNNNQIPGKPTSFIEVALSNSGNRSVRLSYATGQPPNTYKITATSVSGETWPTGTFAMALY